MDERDLAKLNLPEPIKAPLGALHDVGVFRPMRGMGPGAIAAAQARAMMAQREIVVERHRMHEARRLALEADRVRQEEAARRIRERQKANEDEREAKRRRVVAGIDASLGPRGPARR